MAAQSLLAKLGMRTAILGSAASLAIAAPIAEGDPSMAAHTASNRIGHYYDRTAGSEKTGHVVMGTEILTVSVRGVSSNRSAVLQNEMFGLNAGNTGMTGLRNSLLGYTAGLSLTSGARNSVVGASALTAGTSTSDNVAVGYRALAAATSDNSVAVGSRAGELITSGTGNIFLGADAGDNTAVAASGRFVAGSNTVSIADVWFGNGEVNAAPASYVIHGVGGLGADIGGGSVAIAAGAGTGSGVGGAINLQTAKATTTSSTPNALTTRLSILQDGGVDWTGIPTVSAPAPSAAGHGIIFYDSTASAFKISASGGAYSVIGTGSGSVTSVGVSSTDLSVSGSPVTGSGVITLNINAAAVSLAKMANLAANSIIGNNTGSPATPLALTGTQVTAMLDNFTSVAKGLVPLSGGGTTNFLRADGAWAVAGSGTVTTVSVVTANGISGSVATATTTPAITLTLGAITPSSVAATGLITGNNLISGTGTPEGAVTAAVGALFERTDGSTGTTLYIKETGAGNTGWVAVAGATGTIGGSIATTQVAFGSGANTIQGSATLTYTATAGMAMAPTAVATGAQKALVITGAANTNQTTATEVPDVDFNLARTVQFATGAKATQRAVVIRAPTWSAVGTTTITTGATLSITGAPVAGTNMTITTGIALNIEAGLLRTAASTTTVAGLRLPHGSAPTSPVNGDMWTTTGNLFARINGATIQYGGITGVQATYVAVGSGVNSLAGTAALTWDATNGFNHTLTAAGNFNPMFGTGAGSATATGINTLYVGALIGGAASSAINRSVLVGTASANVATSLGQCIIIGTDACTAMTTSSRSVYIGPEVAYGTLGNSFCVTIGYQAGAFATGNSNISIGGNAGTGNGAGPTGGDNIAIGTAALQNYLTDAGNIVLGTSALSNQQSATNGGRNIAIGHNAGYYNTTGDRNVFIGYGTGISNTGTTGNTTGYSNIFIGYQAGDATNPIDTERFVAGSNAAVLRSVCFGAGESSTVPNSIFYNNTNAVGTNVDCFTMAAYFQAHRGTGSGRGASIRFMTASAGAPGTTSNPGTERFAVMGDGSTEWVGIATTSQPAVSVGSRATIYYDSTAQLFKYSANGGAYVNLIGAAAAAGASTQVQFNTSGALDATAGLTFDKTGIVLSVVGTGTATALNDLMIQSSDTVNSFIQNNIQNLSTGAAASSDWIATADNGNDTTNYIDMGINGSGWATGSWTINGVDDGYLYTGSTHLAVGTAAAGKNIVLFTGGTLAANTRATISDTAFVLAPGVAAGGSVVGLTYTGPANTNLATTVEVNDWNINLARTVQWATGTITTQRAIRIQAPTYAFVGSSTITTASTLSVSNAPVAGTNATITNRYAINVEAGAYGGPLGTAPLPTYSVGQANTGMYSTGAGFIGFSTGGTLRLTIDATAYTATLPFRGPNGSAGTPTYSFSGDTNCGIFGTGSDVIGMGLNGVEGARFQTTSTQSSGNLNVAPAVVTSGAACVLRIATPADTAQTTLTEASSVIFDFTTSRQWATGTVPTQRAVRIVAPTYAFVAASTMTTAATVAITNAPIAGTNATITNSYALWLQAGKLQCDGTTDASSISTGMISTLGGLSAAKNGVFGQNVVWGVVSVATAAGTTTLTSASARTQIFTGATTQTLQLPAANAFGAGVSVVYVVINRSSGTVTAQRAGADTFAGGGTTDAITTTQQRYYVSDGVSVWYTLAV